CVLTELRICNFAIIDAIELEFADGFTVFTGETGAGKSILVDAVDLLVGGRASADLIRSGAEEAEVSGVFSLKEASPVAQRLTERRDTLADRRAREDLLRYQLEEITTANLRPGEDRELEREKLLRSQGRRLAELVQATYGPLYEEDPSILQGLGSLTGSLKE